MLEVPVIIILIGCSTLLVGYILRLSFFYQNVRMLIFYVSNVIEKHNKNSKTYYNGYYRKRGGTIVEEKLELTQETLPTND